MNKLKGDLSPVMLKEIFHESVELYGKSCKRDWMAKVACLSHTNASNFQWPLQSLLLR